MRQRFHSTRALPANVALINQGLRNKPPGSKPPHVVHNPSRKAGMSGWKHGYKPFHYKHKGKYWRRHYYPVFVGGLWYWYWYDSLYDGEPAVYEEVVLPECDPDSDDCTEPQLIAPAIVEGRATQEDLDRCAARYKSFKPETGTYLAAPGSTRVCPYLL